MTEPAQQQPEEGPLPRTRVAVDGWLEKWGRYRVVAGDRPMTREDIERLIEVNGGTAERLNLSERDLHGASLWRAHLEAAYLVRANLKGANLWEANLKGAFLGSALFEDADLTNANLESADLLQANLHGASLRHANLVGANFEDANLEAVRLYGARIDRDTTRFRRARWGEKMMLGEELAKEWGECLDPYRDLKQWHQHHGDYDTAGKFHDREWECKRKLALQEKNWREAALLWLYSTTFGYGEHPLRVIRTGAAVIAFFALWYFPYSGLPCFQAGCLAGL